MKRDMKQVMKGLISVAYNNAALFLMNEKSKNFFREPSGDTFIPFLLMACVWLFTSLVIIGSFLKSEDRNCKKEQKNEVDSPLRAATIGTTASGKTAMLDIQSLGHEAENAGCKLKVFNITEISSSSWKGYNPFDDMYDILGEDRLSFIEKLSQISEFTIIEEDNLHTRIRYKKKKGYTQEELDKLYSDFMALKNSLKVQIRNVSVQDN